jgi:hypothetical protein
VQPHWTVFLTDFTLPAPAVRKIARHLSTLETRPLFVRVDRSENGLSRHLRSAGVNLQRHYVSLHSIVAQQSNRRRVHRMFAELPHSDLARLEIPWQECGFKPAFASYLLDIVMRGDYAEQDQISDRFYDLLSLRKPYRVTVETKAGRLEVTDTEVWFDFAGQLREGEGRFLPGGEVAYNGRGIDGEFLVDGAILPAAQWPAAAGEAEQLQVVSGFLRKYPITFRIRKGRVVAAEGDRRTAGIFSRFFDRDDRYRDVTEVGISFNRACDAFVHDWAAVSNETRPGVHIGIGGGGSARNSGVLVHIDCITANCRVFVNSHPFLSASS